MNRVRAVKSLAALAQETRLEAFRLLVQASPQGLPAGEIAAALGVPPNTLELPFRSAAVRRSRERAPQWPLDDLLGEFFRHDRARRLPH